MMSDPAGVGRWVCWIYRRLPPPDRRLPPPLGRRTPELPPIEPVRRPPLPQPLRDGVPPPQEPVEPPHVLRLREPPLSTLPMMPPRIIESASMPPERP